MKRIAALRVPPVLLGKRTRAKDSRARNPRAKRIKTTLLPVEDGGARSVRLGDCGGGLVDVLVAREGLDAVPRQNAAAEREA